MQEFKPFDVELSGKNTYTRHVTEPHPAQIACQSTRDHIVGRCDGGDG
jgi:hypothetical protein